MLTVRYALTRAELRAWYKVTWLRKLWAYHLAIVILLCGSFALAQIGGSAASGLIHGATASGLMIVFMVVWPQLRYRSEERALTFDAAGLSYVRGPQRGHMPWTRIGSVADTEDGIIITGRNQSAFIVPTRAFGGEGGKAAAFRTISGLYRKAL